MAKEMEVKQCGACKKYYDINSYESCPHCGSSKSETNGVTTEEEKKNKVGRLADLFSRKEKKEKKDDFVSVPIQESYIDDEPESFKTVQETVQEPVKFATSERISSERPSIDIKPVLPSGNVINKPENRNVSVRTQEDDMKTVQIYNTKSEPVVGWLVCVKGECLGESFEIYGGNNKLGRGSDSDICIADSTISREQATIKFEPRKQKFHLMPVDNGKFMYIDGEEVLDRVCLEPHMHIEIGEKVELIFVPLCGDNFNWKDYIEE